MRLYRFLSEPVTTTEARGWRVFYAFLVLRIGVEWIADVVRAIA